MSVTRFIAIAAALVLSSPYVSGEDESYTDKALVIFLDSLTDNKSFYPRTLNLLSDIKAPESLVLLTNYYIGEGGSEILGQLITKEGHSVLPILQRELDLPVRCNQKYMRACIQERRVKTELILEYIAAVKSGKVLCPDLNNCPAPNPPLNRTREKPRAG